MNGQPDRRGDWGDAFLFVAQQGRGRGGHREPDGHLGPPRALARDGARPRCVGPCARHTVSDSASSSRWRLLLRWFPLLPASAFLWMPLPPCQDLFAQAALLQVAHQGPDAFWTMGPWWGHSAVFYVIGGLIAEATGSLAAARLLAMVGLWLLPVGAWRLARHLDGDEDMAVWGGLLLGLGHLAFLGFLPFQVALGTTMCLLPETVGRKTSSGAVGWAAGSSVTVWALHALALPALWMGLLALAPDRRRWITIMSAILLPGLLWWITRSTSVAVVWPRDGLDPSEGFMRLWRFLGPPATGPWWLPGLWLTAVILVHLGSWRRNRPEGRRVAVMFWAFLLGAITLPDYLQQPRIVHPWIRLAPFFGGMIVASLPRSEVRRVHRRVTGLVLAILIGWTWAIGIHENALLRPAAEAIRSLPPSEVVLGVTMHRPPAGSWMRTYPGLHLPFLYQADGLGSTLAPFTHGDSPVRLRHVPAAIAELALQDVRRYVDEGSALATLAVTDGGNEPTFLAIAGLGDLPPCGVSFPEPWRCFRLRGGPMPPTP